MTVDERRMNTSFNDLSRQQAQQSYMDLHSLQDIRRTSGDDKDLGLRQVAQQFESMFIQMMLKSMRSANEVFAKDNPLNSFESGYYRDMYDNQLSVSLSGKNLGIADAFYRQMQRNYLGGETPSDNDLSQASLPNKSTWENRIVDSVNHQYQPSSSIAEASPTHSVPQRIIDASALKSIKSPEDFINAVAPYAKKAAKALGVDYRVLVAQSALETGWGEHIIKDKNGNQSFNLFNIKADKRWDGPSVAISTIEYVGGVAEREKAHFRRYSSIEDSFNDYQDFLSQPRYQKALSVTDDANAFIQELQNAGYATDPQYSQKISRILLQTKHYE